MKKILLILSLFYSITFAASEYTIYTYHNHAPFIVDKKVGLTVDLITMLNKQANTNMTFKLKVVPRSRLNYILKPWINGECNNGGCNNKWAVLWVNHKWGFGKDSLKNFEWIPLFVDSNAIISSKDYPIEYTKPMDLKHKSLAGITGHKYVGIDDLVKQGLIKRVDGFDEVNNLKIVLANRADVTLLPQSAFNYYLKLNPAFENLHVSKKPHQKYMRNIMTPKTNKTLIEFLEKINFDSLFQ